MPDHHHLPQPGNKEPRRDDTSLVSQAVILTFIFFVIEAVGGYFAGSLALFSDATHMLSDLSALLLTYGALFILSFAISRTCSYVPKIYTVIMDQ